MPSVTSFNNPSKLRSSVGPWLIILALLGLLDASYLTVKFYMGELPPCSLASGCETVLSSGFSHFGPVPLALLGALYYAILGGLFIVAYSRASLRAFMQALFLVSFGLVMSAFLTGLQMFVLKSYCMYCLFSALVTTSIFILAVISHRDLKRSILKAEEPAP